MKTKQPIVLNRALTPRKGGKGNEPSPKASEAGAWRSMVKVIGNMRAQIELLAGATRPLITMGEPFPITASELQTMQAREITVNGVTFTAFVRKENET